MSFDGFPFVVGWELTLVCNLRCRHCGSSADLPREDELTLEESLAICDQFPELFVQEVNFTGGEPLLRPDWQRIADHLRKLDLKTKILTNGVTDGLEATHDYIRGHKGLFRRVLTGIKLVLNADIPLTLITTVNALNIRELSSLFALLRSLGVSSWQIQPIFPLGRANDAAELELTQQSYMDLRP